MHSSDTPNPIDGFTLELLRSGYALTGLAAELSEALPADAHPGEEPGALVLEMISGTIRCFLDEADEADVERATGLMAGAMDRVTEHLQLALALRGRMEGHANAGRLCDEPPPARSHPGVVFDEAPVALAIHAEAGPEDKLGELVAGLLDCGGVLSQLVAATADPAKPNDGQGGALVPITDVVRVLVRDVLAELEVRHKPQDVATAARIVREAAEVMATDIFFVDPGLN